MMAMLLARPTLTGLLLLLAPATGQVVQLEVTVDPLRGSDALTEHGGGCRASHEMRLPAAALRSLEGAQQWLQAAATCLEDQPANITVYLAPGTHNVPRGGLQLGPADSPRHGHVHWKGSSLDGTPSGSSISGGVAVVGWQPAVLEPGLPPGVWEAEVPADLPVGFVARHMFVNGHRAKRTRRFVAEVLDRIALEPSPPSSGGCAADAGSSTPCCGQPGNPVHPYMQCNGTYPICVNYTLDKHMGYCINRTGARHPEPPCAKAPCAYTAEHRVTWADNGSNAELVYSAGGGATWTESRCAVEEISWLPVANRSRLLMKQPCFWNLLNRDWQPFSTESKCSGYGPKSPAYPTGSVTNCTLPRYVENVREHLQPGEFYHYVSRGKLLYYPQPAEQANLLQQRRQQAGDTATQGGVGGIDAILAVEEKLVGLSGASRHTFEGVTFEHATWLRPGMGLGFVEAQSGACDVCAYGTPIPGEMCGANDDDALTAGNVAVTNGSRSIEFVNCSFRHLGAAAASTRGGSQDIAWRRCSFEGAIVLGDITALSRNSSTPVSQWDQRLTVEDCTIRNLPVEYSGAAAVFGGYVANATIQHNLIANSSWNAIALGWGWGREGSGRSWNKIVANRVDTIGVQRCCDLGAIYTLGPQPHSVIRANHLTQTATPTDGTAFCPNCYGGGGRTEGNAIYLDNGSGGITVNENVIDGIWDILLMVHTTAGAYGPSSGNTKHPGGVCPGCPDDTDDTMAAAGNASTCCGVAFEKNWLHTAQGVWPPSTLGGGTTPSQVKWLVLSDNEVLAPSDALPAAAMAVVAAAGPRTIV